MKRYAGGDSGIAEYESGEDFIRVKFHHGGVYLYTHDKPGWHHVERMKILATRGSGLQGYINKSVGSSYESRET